jgi:hypothetical protein
MKNLMRVLFGFIIGAVVLFLTYEDNLEDIIKVSTHTINIDTVYSTSLLKVEIDIDTIRTYYKDKLVIVTGVNSISADYNVKKSEWIDSILLTKPNRYYLNYSLQMYIEYDDFKMYEYYHSRDHVFIENYKGKWVLYHSDNLGKHNKVSEQTQKNIETVVDRYWRILTK